MFYFSIFQSTPVEAHTELAWKRASISTRLITREEQLYGMPLKQVIMPYFLYY